MMSFPAPHCTGTKKNFNQMSSFTWFRKATPSVAADPSFVDACGVRLFVSYLSDRNHGVPLEQNECSIDDSLDE
jgi:hypothetical protein